jgi:hypothetical protein
MAMTYIMATKSAHHDHETSMQKSEFRSDPAARGQQAEAILAKLFEDAGWSVRVGDRIGASEVDLIVHSQGVVYAVEVKAAAEGRSDRLIPLWSQACLQAARAANSKYRPLAVVAAPSISPKVARHVLDFAKEYAPDVAAGVIDFAGLSRFRGPHLEGLEAEGDYPLSMRRSAGLPAPSESANLFSDLNQWMLKVLLAPELPQHLLSAPRERYRNASELARAAKVSVVSANRFVRQLQRDGYLHESAPHLALVRREDVFRSWQALAMRPVKEVPMRFLLGGSKEMELKRVLRSSLSCLALFAAAEALHFGFVHGVPPYVYVKRLGAPSIAGLKNVVPAEPWEMPDVILRQAPAPHSVFHGSVKVDDMPVSDVLQVWLDVSSHPSRGQEQADLIRRRILNPLIKGKHVSG